MPGQTTQVYVHTGDWDDSSRQDPTCKWMEHYTRLLDGPGGLDKFEALNAKDWQYSKSNGQIFAGGQESHQALRQDYGFFTEFHHEPYFATSWEKSDGSGYELSGNAWLFANLPGNHSGQTHKDLTGKEWQIKVPGSFHFVYNKNASAQHDGIELQSTAICSDSGPVVVELLKRGIITPDQLGV